LLLKPCALCERKEVLVKHGLVEAVLEDLTQALDQFYAAVDSGAEGGRRAWGRARSCPR
jgi:hypothetical protein